MKDNNKRKFPNATRQPFHLDHLRKEEALQRQAAYDALSLDEKIARLPPEPHAKKQRARLLAMKDKKVAPKPATVATTEKTDVVETSINNKQSNKKKYMKGVK